MSDIRPRGRDPQSGRPWRAEAARPSSTAFRAGKPGRESRPVRATRPKPLRVDLGCGVAKTAGFLGIDRFPLAGVDLVCDVDAGLPLADDSVAELLSSHSMEHFRDIVGLMKDIWRVCEDRALVTLICPYYNTRLNQANPYHVQPLNEHSARFFTNAAESVLEAEEYAFPHANDFGLGQSDNSTWREDFRVLKQEFFYLPAYRSLDERAKRLLRQSLSDVCDQFVLRLLVVKSPIDVREVQERAERTFFRDTDALAMRRRLELEPGAPNAFAVLSDLPAQLDSARAQADGAQVGLEALREVVATAVTQSSQAFGRLDAVPGRLSRLQEHAGTLARRADDADHAIQALREVVAEAVTQSSQAFARLDAVPADLERLALRADGADDAVEALRRVVAEAVTQSSQAFARLEAVPADLERLALRADGADDAVEALRRVVAEAVTQSSQAFARLEAVPAELQRLALRADGADDAVEALRRVVAEAVTQSSQAFARLEDVPSDLARLTRRADDADEAVEALREVVATAVTQSSQAFARLDALPAEVQALARRADGADQATEALRGVVATAVTQSSQAFARLDQAGAEVAGRLARVDARLEGFEADQVRFADARRRLDAAEAEVEASSRALRRLDALPDQVAELRDEVGDAVRQARKVAGLPARLTDLEAAAEEAAGELVRLAPLPSRLQAAEAGLAEATSALSELRMLEPRVETLHAEREATAEVIAHHRAELARAFEAVERLAVRLRDLDALEGQYDAVNARSRAVHAEATRRAQAYEDRLNVGLAEMQAATATAEALAAEARNAVAAALEAASARADASAARHAEAAFTRAEEVVGRTAEVLSARADAALSLLEARALQETSAAAGRTEFGLQRLTAREIRREREGAPWLLALRRWVRRGHDLRGALPPAFRGQAKAGEVVHLEHYWRAGDLDELALRVGVGSLTGLELAADAFMPPAAPIHGLEFTLRDAAGAVLAEGACAIEPDVGAAPLRLRFPPCAVSGGPLTLQLRGTVSAEAAGLRLYERRRLRPLTRQARGRGWLVVPVYA